MFSLGCQFLFPSREGTIIRDCAILVSAVGGIQPGDIPQHLLDTGTKQGSEFDANEYFTVLTRISMSEGYALDYVYQNDSLGGFPLLYARRADQAAYASMADVPQNTQLPDFHGYLEVEDLEGGYFEYVVMDIMANQFYLFWHANYNDTQIVCSRGDVNDIISAVSSGDFGYKLDLLQ